MGEYMFLIEVAAFFGVIIAWAVWDYRKTDKALKESRAKEKSSTTDRP